MGQGSPSFIIVVSTNKLISMVTLYIRKKDSIWVNYLRSVQDMDNFIDALNIDKPIVIGDVSLFNKPMKNRLLKLIEDRNNVSLYSSTDIGDPVILSRVARVVKELPQVISNGIEVDNYNESNKDYQSVSSNLSTLPFDIKLLSTKLSSRRLNLLLSVYSK